MQAPDLLSSYPGRLGHETVAAELAQRYPAWFEGCHCFGGNRSFPGSFFWRSEDGLDWSPARALRRRLFFFSLFFFSFFLLFLFFLQCFARSS
ncbi:hypothetical protein QBC32DRAFT_347010, partial [Pseudoneurospora amorphoporcata]